MPSNHIYEIIEDKNGFLWVATDNGISRFDGKRFANYTTKNGLPSNDVLQIKIEIDGTIWVNCYKQPPSYFDEINNQFVSFENNKTVVKSSNSLLYPTINPFGGIFFSNVNGSMFFKNKNLENISKSRYNNLFVANELFRIKIASEKENVDNYLIYNSKNKLIGQIDYDNRNVILNHKIEGDKIYQLSINNILITKITSIYPFKVEKKNLVFNETLKWFCLSKNELAVITNSGKTIIYDNKNINVKSEIAIDNDVNYYYKDKNNMVWIATLNKGLLKYSTSTIRNINPKNKINTNLLSISLNDKNSIFAGNYDGELLEVNKKISTTYNLNKHNNPIWIRSIATFKDSIYSISDHGYNINYGENNNVINSNNQRLPLKTATKLNDSILLLGSSSGLYKLNIKKNSYTYLGFEKERILSIDKINNQEFYFTANSGIYKYNIITNKNSLFFSNTSIQNDNIQNVIKSKKGGIWFTTFKGNLYYLNPKRKLFSIINSDNIPINITKIIEIENQLWITSKDGIYVLNTSKFPKYSVRKISKSDGLNSNFINDITYKNDSVYVATSNGISIIPVSIKNKNYTIVPIVISARINNIAVPIKKSYSLEANQKNIILEIGAVNLTGHFKKFQYQLNDSKIWYNLEGNILNLLLKGGENNIEVRAIDQNNYKSKKTLNIKINVAIPIQEQPLFWAAIIILFTGFIFIYFFRRKLDKQKATFEKQIELEQQRNKITADLHDDIGSTLSSLQINSAVANMLLHENPEETRKILAKIESQSQNISDKIGDIIWSMKPGKEEFMTMSTRIKNFVNEILGSTNIQYEIKIDTNIDVFITDITMRKNIILIIKESVNNAAKYSNATLISVIITLKNNTVFLEIKDNGCGFEPTKLTGNGLGNIKRRTEELNGILTINSKINQGTVIQISISVIT